MTRTITQRELRNQSGEIMRALDRGEDFIVTRNGVPVGELRPVGRFVDLAVLLEAFHTVATMDGERFPDRRRPDPRPGHRAARLSARSYGRVYVATPTSDRKPLGAWAVDLLIAAVAMANDLPLFTRNPDDFQHLQSIGLDVPPSDLLTKQGPPIASAAAAEPLWRCSRRGDQPSTWLSDRHASAST